VLNVHSYSYGEVNVDGTNYMVLSRDRDAVQVTVQRLLTVPVKGWKSSNIWEHSFNISKFYSGRYYE